MFDLDGVLLDSEQVWDGARRDLVAQTGGRWTEEAPTDMLGMSAPEWSRYVVEQLHVPLTPEQVNAAVVEAMLREYDERLPLLPGARAAVERMAERWPLGLASSSNRPLIELALELSGLARLFGAVVSSEEVPRGKPAPDVYLEAARRLDVDAGACAAVEDSENGIRSAHGAGMRVLAIPNPTYPPDDDALALADVVLPSIRELDVRAVAPDAA